MFFKFHIFCCVNKRPDSAVRECCIKTTQSNKLYEKFFDLKPKNIRLNRSGCHDKFESGPLIVNYPQGVLYNYKN